MLDFFNPDKKILNKINKQAQEIDALAKTYAGFSDEQLKNKTVEFKTRLSKGETLDDILVEAYATVREAAKRTIGEYPFFVQLEGAIALHNGDIAEMLTGSGKTLTSTMPVYLNALGGKGVHVVTVNEYLAQRDSEWMGKIYNFLGLTVGLNKHGLLPSEKKQAFLCDITYTTSSELGFDYLKDNMVTKVEDRVLRELNFALIDEADSILIDDARNPLIISGAPEQVSNFYINADDFVKTLKNNIDYTINLKENTISLTREGIAKAERFFHLDNLYSQDSGDVVHFVAQALRANYLMKKDVNYVIDEGDIMLIDLNTGRKKPGTQWSDGLHQAVQAKERVAIKEETKTIASITYQNFFRLYNKLAGMTGTAKTEAEEFLEIYNMRVVVIPPNKPVIRKDLPDLIYGTKNAKYKAIIKEIKRIHETGQPVLVGTIAIETSELISNLLTKEHIPHEVLNAKNHEREAEIISNAGQLNAVTIATNMAGRGTDIKLGAGVAELGGLAIIGTERHESRRIDNQLRGRSGRQGDPGSSRFFVSLEDDLMLRFGGKDTFKVFSQLGDMAIENKAVSSAIANAQKRVEGSNFDLRKAVLDYDMVMATQRNIIYQERNYILEHENVREVIERLFKRSITACITYSVQSDPDNKINYDKILNKLSFTHSNLTINDIKGKNIKEISNNVINKTYKDYCKKIETLLQENPEMPSEEISKIEKYIILKLIDHGWMEHLDLITKLKDGIGLRAYAQNNPLQAYKEEAFKMFEDMMDNISINSVYTLTDIKIQKMPAD